MTRIQKEDEAFIKYWILISQLLSLEYESKEISIQLFKSEELFATITNRQGINLSGEFSDNFLKKILVQGIKELK